MVKMVGFLLCVFYYSNKSWKEGSVRNTDWCQVWDRDRERQVLGPEHRWGCCGWHQPSPFGTEGHLSQLTHPRYQPSAVSLVWESPSAEESHPTQCHSHFPGAARIQWEVKAGAEKAQSSWPQMGTALKGKPSFRAPWGVSWNLAVTMSQLLSLSHLASFTCPTGVVLRAFSNKLAAC